MKISEKLTELEGAIDAAAEREDGQRFADLIAQLEELAKLGARIGFDQEVES